MYEKEVLLMQTGSS